MPYCSIPFTLRSQRTQASFGAVVLAAAITASALLSTPISARAAVSPTRAVFAYSHLPALVSRLSPLRATDASELINIDFALRPRNADQIQPLLSSISNPRSPDYGRYLTQADYRNRFGPTQAQVNQIIGYAKSQGLTVTHVSPSGLLVRAVGTAAQMEMAFGVKLRDYVSPDPRDNARIFHAPDQEPTIDAAIAPLLTGIVGLDNAAVPHSSIHEAPSPALVAAQTYSPPYATGHAGFSPYDVANIYSLNTSLKTYSGQNQVLGLIEFDTYYSSDITNWESGYPLTSTFPSVLPISVDGYNTSATPGGDQPEVTLDIDMLLNLAYNAKQIRVYETSDSYIDLFDAMANDSTPPSMISSSYDYAEDGVSASYEQSEADTLQQLALQGQTVCICTLDSGAYADGQSGTPNVVADGAQPTVVSVGATDLADNYNSTTNTVSFGSETSWYFPQDGSGITGGGGGISQYWSIPSWQVGVCATSANPQGSNTMRNLPDVSLYGDYDTGGYDVYITNSEQSGWEGYNGTSAATPLWAAMLADVNEERIANHQPVLGLATPQIYALAKSSAYSTDFYDVNDQSTNGYYRAVTGYDNSTGWGTALNGSQLIADLAAQASVADFSLTLSPKSVGAGATVTGTVTLAQPAYTSETFTLTSSNASALSVPASGTIASGATSATFTGTAATESANTNVTVTASLDGYTASSSVTITGSGPSLNSLTLAASSVAGSTSLSGNRISLTGAASANTTVKLTSSNTAVATVPSSETILSGSSSHSFTVTTSAVTTATTVTITATLNGVTKTATLTVLPSLSSVKLAASSTTGGTSLTGNRIYFTGAVNANTAVTLTSSNTAAATVPSSETILSGSSSHSFTITTKAVTANTTVTITATQGGVTKTATLTVTP